MWDIGGGWSGGLQQVVGLGGVGVGIKEVVGWGSKGWGFRDGVWVVGIWGSGSGGVGGGGVGLRNGVFRGHSIDLLPKLWLLHLLTKGMTIENTKTI